MPHAVYSLLKIVHLWHFSDSMLAKGHIYRL